VSDERETPSRGALRHVPTVLVLAGLAALGVVGHRAGWKIGKFSEALGGGAAPAKEDWCADHNVPESRCISCHPELAGADAKDWCREHGVPESQCTVCHPEILTKGAAADWCREHGVPETSCTICHPEIAVKDPSKADPAAAKVSLDPAAPPPPDPAACRTHALRVQFASAEAVKKAGIRLEAVEQKPMPARVAANGSVDYDRSRYARVSARVGGTVRRVLRDAGDRVRKGEVLALVDSADVGRAKAAFLEAFARSEVKEKALVRLRASAEAGFRTKGEAAEAEAELREARIALFGAREALLNLGFEVRPEEFEGLGEEAVAARLRGLGLPGDIAGAAVSSNLTPVSSPLDGVVLSKEAVEGETVEAAATLFVVSDVSRMWILLDVRLEDAPLLALGQAVSFRPDAGTEDAVAGKVAWISTGADPTTRTLRVRAEAPNPEGRLRAGAFGNGRITVRENPAAVAVPSGAVHWEGCCHVVFVRLTDEVFQTRKVRLGVRSGGLTEVTAGLLPGEVVATEGSAVLKAEILKSRLGAGCCAEE
jgi:cobalt-zinc-cadmium efflux system membrane fusion protein